MIASGTSGVWFHSNWMPEIKKAHGQCNGQANWAIPIFSNYEKSLRQIPIPSTSRIQSAHTPGSHGIIFKKKIEKPSMRIRSTSTRTIRSANPVGPQGIKNLEWKKNWRTKPGFKKLFIFDNASSRHQPTAIIMDGPLGSYGSFLIDIIKTNSSMQIWAPITRQIQSPNSLHRPGIIV